MDMDFTEGFTLYKFHNDQRGKSKSSKLTLAKKDEVRSGPDAYHPQGEEAGFEHWSQLWSRV